jgi:hypothetical protein
MMIFKIFATLLFLKSLNSIKPDTFCFLDRYHDSLCKRNQCGINICSFDEKSCTNLKRWSNLTDKYADSEKIGPFFNFFSKIKECKTSDYIKLSSIVCSNKLKCNRENQNFFRYMIGLKPKECFCSGKFKYDCGNEFCSVNQKQCDSVFKSDKKSKLKSKEIKNCAILTKTI